MKSVNFSQRSFSIESVAAWILPISGENHREIILEFGNMQTMKWYTDMAIKLK